MIGRTTTGTSGRGAGSGASGVDAAATRVIRGRTTKVVLSGFLLAFAMVHGAGGAVAGGPSFDCDKARGDVERLICADPELADLDVRFARSFAAALARAPADVVRDLKASEKDWRRERNNCARANDPRQCTVSSYETFLSRL